VPRFQALSHRNFRLYFIGQSVTLIGGFAHAVALSWLAYRLSQSSAVLGLVGFASTVPALVVSPVAGVFGDRFSRRKLIMTVLGSVMTLNLLTALLVWRQWIDVSGIVAIALVRGVLFAVEIPTRHALLSELVEDRAALPNAVALHSSALNAARFVGPAVGGVLIGAFGEVSCFLLHAATLAVGLGQLARIRTVRHAHAGSRDPVLAQLSQGVRYAFSHPTIRLLLTALFVVGFTTSPYSHLMPGAVAERHAAHPELVGWFLSSAGLGATAAAVMLAFRRSTRRLPDLILAATVCAGLGLLLFSVSTTLVWSTIGMAMVGFGTIAQASGSNMIIQSVVDEDKRGRVMALYTAMFLGAMPLGSLTLGTLGEAIGAAHALGLGAIGCLAGAVHFALRLRRSPLRRS
jgi:MFS family permease